MNHAEIIALIRDGISTTSMSPQRWADFGAGWGNFTRALRDLLPEQSIIHAIDRDASSIQNIHQNWRDKITLKTHQVDFTQPITDAVFDGHKLDGAVIANALHFVRPDQQIKTLQLLHSYLKPSAPLIVVEYDVTLPRPWIPHPLGYERLIKIAPSAGFTRASLIGSRTSKRTSITMKATLLRA